MIREVTKTEQTITALATQIKYSTWRHLFQSKERRDAVAAWLKADGCKVKKGSSRSQTLHPEYVIDFVGTYETGFGNQDYMTHWSHLYSLEVIAVPPETDEEYWARDREEYIDEIRKTY